MKLESIQKEWSRRIRASITADRTTPDPCDFTNLATTPPDMHNTLTINKRNERKANQS
jgi:hypothetical protein